MRPNSSIATWLDTKMVFGRTMSKMIHSYPAERMDAWLMSRRVDKLRSTRSLRASIARNEGRARPHRA